MTAPSAYASLREKLTGLASVLVVAEASDLPAPLAVDVIGFAPALHCATDADLDAWAAWIGTTPASYIGGSRRFAVGEMFEMPLRLVGPQRQAVPA